MDIALVSGALALMGVAVGYFLTYLNEKRQYARDIKLKELYRKRDVLTTFLGEGLSNFLVMIASDPISKQESIAVNIKNNANLRLLQATFPSDIRIKKATRELWEHAINIPGKPLSERNEISWKMQDQVFALNEILRELNESIEETYI